MALIDTFEQALEDWQQQHRRRIRRLVEPAQPPALLAAENEALRGTTYRINGQVCLSFGSNDYLGLSQHPKVIEAAQLGAARYGVGATGSPLVCGHSPAHEALELALARLTGLPRALYFYAGYAANVGIVPALVGPGDAIFSDALNHACLIDGARLSRADIHVIPHQNLAALEDALARSDARRKLVISDAVFSMDGTVADVPAMLSICEAHDALLLVDDAHGFGVLGPHGEGTLAHLGLVGRDGVAPVWQGGRLDRLLYMATLGKAAGVSGAFVAGHPVLMEWLMQTARTYMFATAAPAMVVEATRAAVQLIENEPHRRVHLQTLVSRLQQGLHELLAHPACPWRLPSSPTAIQPLLVGRNESALGVMATLERQGVWVPAIRPPTVPTGTARLRISLSAAHTPEHVDRLVEALLQAAQPLHK
jgi:8-amino-7-oxononanoate synthase